MGRYVVSGGTSGIGRACVARLLETGNRVLAIGLTESHAAELEAGVPGSQRSRLAVVVTDLRDPVGSRDVVEALGVAPSVDGLINAAGTIGVGGLEDESIDRWTTTIESNLHTAFYLTKALVPSLRLAPAPSIVNVSSACSRARCDSISYAVSKAGMDMLTRHAARDLARYKIRVNSVNPGAVETNLQLTAGLFADRAVYDEWFARISSSHPLGAGSVGDVVESIMFLISPKARWVTGTSLFVDGGRAA